MAYGPTCGGWQRLSDGDGLNRSRWRVGLKATVDPDDSLADAGLVDRYHLSVFPVLLGAGKRLFSEADKDLTKLKLVEQRLAQTAF